MEKCHRKRNRSGSIEQDNGKNENINSHPEGTTCIMLAIIRRSHIRRLKPIMESMKQIMLDMD